MKNILSILGILLILASFSACDLIQKDEHAHAEAEALTLRMNGTSIVTVQDAQVTGRLIVPLNAETNTISITWMDHDGDEIHEEDLEAEYTLGLAINDETVATYNLEDRFSFKLDGKKLGATTLKIDLLHNGHSDFTTPTIPVEVVDA